MLTLSNHHCLSIFSRFFTCGYQAFQNDADFKAKTADALYDIADKLSQKYESKGDDFIVTAQDDQVNVSMPHNTMLLSRQMPSRQIWVSSPISGSLKFDYDNEKDKWYDHKSKQEFSSRILTEIENIQKTEI